MKVRSQSGFSLIELMIAGTLGLLLMAAVGQIFLSSKQSFTAQEAMGNIQENARLAMYFLQRDIRTTGYPKTNGPPALVAGTCPTISACTYTGGTPNVNNPSGTLGAGETCATDAAASGSYDCGVAGGLSDQIELQMQSNTDCLGRNGTFFGGSGIHVANRYYVAINPITRTRHLMCRSFSLNPVNGYAQTAIAGGEQPRSKVSSPSRCFTAWTPTAIRQRPPQYLRYLPHATCGRYTYQVAAADWAKIISVRVGILASSVSGTGGITTADAVQRYLVLDAPIFTRTDSLRRRMFVSTIEIRNRTP